MLLLFSALTLAAEPTITTARMAYCDAIDAAGEAKTSLMLLASVKEQVTAENPEMWGAEQDKMLRESELQSAEADRRLADAKLALLVTAAENGVSSPLNDPTLCREDTPTLRRFLPGMRRPTR